MNSMKNLSDKLLPFFVIGMVGLAFMVGVLWQKVSTLQSGTGTPTGNQNVESLLSENNLKKYAKEIGLNEGNFSSCLASGKFDEAIKADTAQGETAGVTGTPAFFINGRFLGGAFPFDSFKEIIDMELAGKGSSNPKAYSATLQQYYNAAQRSFEPAPKTIALGDSAVEGNKDAKVTIVEFSDFECPFCQRFYSQTLGQIRKEYVETGKVKLVYKQFPLISIHPNAQRAAQASMCAGEQGKFWEMHDKMFSSSAS